MNKLYKCEQCEYAATTKEGLVSHILSEHASIPTENRVVAYLDEDGNYRIGRTDEL